MSSLIVPSHLAEARRKALKQDPGADIKRPLGATTYPDEWFDEEKDRIRERVGWVLDKVRLTLNQVLVAIFVRPEKTAKGIIQLDTDEDKHQGVTGLVLKLGPRCFEDNERMTWTEADKFAEGDWVMFRRGSADGVRLQLNGVECFHFMHEGAIRMVIPRPDVVF